MSSSVNDKKGNELPKPAELFGIDHEDGGVRMGRVLVGVATKGGGAGLHILTWLIRAFWYVTLAIYCLPVLINLRALWRYHATKKLVVRSYDAFMYTWLVITAGPLLTIAAKLGAPTLYLGYLYLIILTYSFYTVGRDVTWRRSWVVFAFALAIIATVFALGEKMEYAFFRKAGEMLQETGLYFPVTFANALSIILLVLYVQMLIERHVSGTITFEGDKLLVQELGETSADHERSSYSIVARTDDVNEFVLGFSKSLLLRPRSSKDPEYIFRHVPGLPYLMGTILEMTTARYADGRYDDDDHHGAGDGDAGGSSGHH